MKVELEYGFSRHFLLGEVCGGYDVRADFLRSFGERSSRCDVNRGLRTAQNLLGAVSLVRGAVRRGSEAERAESTDDVRVLGCDVATQAHSPVLLDVASARQQVARPRTIEPASIKGFRIWELHTATNCRGDKLVDLALNFLNCARVERISPKVRDQTDA